MKDLQSALLLLLLAVYVHGMVVREEEDVCLMPPEPGMCKAYMPRFYYDAESGTCKNFIYGGCGGNGNRFHTLAECQTACMEEDVCLMPPEPGMCKAYMPRFYYDAENSTCKNFIYGGCGGNSNRFHTIAECQTACMEEDVCLMPPEPGMCKAYMPRFYYDAENGTCKNFIYGGCGGNGNRFHTLAGCQTACMEEDVCLMPPEPGMCKAHMPRFYHDAESGTCKNFIYGGCGGNGNRFHTLAGCQTACMDTCDQPKASGPCYGLFPKFYYDKEADKCQEFIYGGCQGNNNRFDTLDDCNATCG